MNATHFAGMRQLGPQVEISMARSDSRHIVFCAIDGLLESGWTAADVVSKFWDDLMAASTHAAKLNTGLAPLRDRAAVGRDLDLSAPHFTVTILDAAQCVTETDFRQRVTDRLAENIAAISQTAARFGK